MTMHKATTRTSFAHNASLLPCCYVGRVKASMPVGAMQQCRHTPSRSVSHSTRHVTLSQGKKAAALHFSEAGGCGGDLGWVAMLHMGHS